MHASRDYESEHPLAQSPPEIWVPDLDQPIALWPWAILFTYLCLNYCNYEIKRFYFFALKDIFQLQNSFISNNFYTWKPLSAYFNYQKIYNHESKVELKRPIKSMSWCYKVHKFYTFPNLVDSCSESIYSLYTALVTWLPCFLSSQHIWRGKSEKKQARTLTIRRSKSPKEKTENFKRTALYLIHCYTARVRYIVYAQ